MNVANKAAKDRTVVDMVQSMKLLQNLEIKRFHAKKEIVWKWTKN
jgi:hypothetical protein